MEDTKLPSLLSRSLIKITRAADRRPPRPEDSVVAPSTESGKKPGPMTPVEILAGRVRKEPKGRFVTAGKLESGASALIQRYEAEQASLRRIVERKMMGRKSPRAATETDRRSSMGKPAAGRGTFRGDSASRGAASDAPRWKREGASDGAASMSGDRSMGGAKSFAGKPYTPRRSFTGGTSAPRPCRPLGGSPFDDRPPRQDGDRRATFGGRPRSFGDKPRSGDFRSQSDRSGRTFGGRPSSPGRTGGRGRGGSPFGSLGKPRSGFKPSGFKGPKGPGRGKPRG